MAKRKKSDLLKEVRAQLQQYIDKNYSTVEEFCWDKGLNKATVSNFLNEKKDFQISTLSKIATAIGREVFIQFK